MAEALSFCGFAHSEMPDKIGKLCDPENTRRTTLFKEADDRKGTNLKTYLLISVFLPAELSVSGYSEAREAYTVADIYPGAGSSGINYLANVNGALFLRADDHPNGSESWKSDGTSVGIVMVKQITCHRWHRLRTTGVANKPPTRRGHWRSFRQFIEIVAYF